MSFYESMIPKERLIDWMSNYTLEISAKEIENIEKISDKLPQGLKIYLPHIAGKDFIKEVVTPAKKLHQKGFLPVAHLAARNLKDEADLKHHLKVLTQEVCTKEILLLAGGINPPSGKFSSAMDLLQTGLFTEYGFKKIGVAGHPEKHSQVAEQVLLNSLVVKQEFLVKNKMQMYIMTQFCFSVEPVMDWLSKLENNKIKASIYLGVVGIVGIVSLIKYAIYCGVGNSLQVIKDKAKNMIQLATKYQNEEFFLPLLEVLQTNYPNVKGLHVFSFGTGEKTIDYFQQWKIKTKQK